MNNTNPTANLDYDGSLVPQDYTNTTNDIDYDGSYRYLRIRQTP